MFFSTKVGHNIHIEIGYIRTDMGPLHQVIQPGTIYMCQRYIVYHMIVSVKTNGRSFVKKNKEADIFNVIEMLLYHSKISKNKKALCKLKI